MKPRPIHVLMLSVGLFATAVLAETIEVRGVVQESGRLAPPRGEIPLPGVRVELKGKALSTLTDDHHIRRWVALWIWGVSQWRASNS